MAQAVVEAFVNGVSVYKETYPSGEKAAGHYTLHGFPKEMRERIAAALLRASEMQLPADLRITVNGYPRYEHPYRNAEAGARRWRDRFEASAALRRVIRGLRNPDAAPAVPVNGRRTFDHELAARLYAVLPDYAAVGRALNVTGDAVRLAIQRNVASLDG